MRRLSLTLVPVALVVACASLAAFPPDPTSSLTPAPIRAITPSSAPSPAAGPTLELVMPPPTATAPATAGRPHVFVVVMENTSLATALQASSIATLASKYALAANYHAVSQPSLPNYLALTSGSTWGVRDDGYHALPVGGLGAQLSAAGITWRAYMEGMTKAGCLGSPYPYAVKHNPFAYYGGACPANVVALDALDGDLAHDTPSFVWITPDLCHDGHDCALSEAAAWLDGLVSRIVASQAWRGGGVLFVVWDEGDGRSNVVPLIVVAPTLVAHRTDAQYDHYSLLATVEDVFGLPRLGAAAEARPLTDLLSLHTP